MIFEFLHKINVHVFCVYIYCKTTNFSVLIILAKLATGIKTLILIPANINTQSCGRT